MSALVSLAFHIGTEKTVLLYENLIKSLLICNRYPETEVILVESGGNQKIRDWMSEINFDDYLVDFDGRKTGIKKDDNTRVQKKLCFVDFDSPTNKDWNWVNGCVMSAINESIIQSSGEYFVCLHEDNQFTVQGDTISDFINATNIAGAVDTQIHFFTQQGYKYIKEDNKFAQRESLGGTIVFPIKKMKYCPFAFCSKRFYESLGLLEIRAGDMSHKSIERMTEKCRELMCKRYYPAVPAGAWIANDDIDSMISLIKHHRKKDIDYVAMEIFKKESVHQMSEILNSPFPTEFFLKRLNK